MPPRDWNLRIKDILESIAKISRYTEGITFEIFSADEMIIDAVVRNIAIIGEAARNIPVEIQEKYPQIPWDEICGMRNIVIHQYFGVSLSILWQTVKEDLPKLAKMLNDITEQEI